MSEIETKHKHSHMTAAKRDSGQLKSVSRDTSLANSIEAKRKEYENNLLYVDFLRGFDKGVEMARKEFLDKIKKWNVEACCHGIQQRDLLKELGDKEWLNY